MKTEMSNDVIEKEDRCSCMVMRVLSAGLVRIRSYLSEREAEIATIANVRWPYVEILRDRWGGHRFFSKEVLSDEKQARKWVLRMNRAKIVYFHFHDEAERRNVESTLLENTGLRKSQIVFVEVLSDPSTWTGTFGDENKYDDDDWDEVLGCLSSDGDIAAAVVSSDVDPIDESWRVRRKALGNWLSDSKLIVVQFLFSLCDGCHLRIGGRWKENNLDAFNVGDQNEAKHLSLGEIREKKHPVISNIHHIDGGLRTIFATGSARGKIIASYSNGVPLVVESKRSLGVNLFPISGSPFWQKTKDNDIDILIGNAVTFAITKGIATSSSFYNDDD